MIDHFAIQVSDLEKSKGFYEKVLAPLECEVMLELGNTVGFNEKASSTRKTSSSFWIAEGEPKPFHFAFSANSKEEVESFYKNALAAGGKDNGEPGYRENYGPNYYAAFVIDPDGYKIEAVYHGA